jgi:hypothetical protein
MKASGKNLKSLDANKQKKIKTNIVDEHQQRQIIRDNFLGVNQAFLEPSRSMAFQNNNQMIKANPSLSNMQNVDFKRNMRMLKNQNNNYY